MCRIFYIMGKSASGKDHIHEALLEKKELRLSPLVIYTTRPIRSGETDGVEYYFTDEKKLETLRGKGKIIEERCYKTVEGPWYYFTADDGQFSDERNYLGIGTLASYACLRNYFGEERVVPLYIETEDGLRLKRAIQREEKQPVPKYKEMCRRFLADCEDFSEEKLAEQGISRRFQNNGTLEKCIQVLAEEIENVISAAQTLSGSNSR